jgi:hypothetical protein
MKWIAKPKGLRWTGRHKNEAKKIGFRWDGNDMSMQADSRPCTPWGCVVRKYIPRRPPRKGFGVVVGMLIGTHDEFGKPRHVNTATSLL